MKYKNVLWAGLSMMASMITTICFAQDTIPYKELPPVTVTPTTKEVPEKVWVNFREYFANAHDLKWYQLNKDYLVKFMLNEEQNRALFSKRGRLIYTISYGYEKSLPENLRKQVKSIYYDYDITRAIKVSEAGRQIWVVNVEDPKTFILVRLEDGEMEEVQKMNKS